MTPEELKQQLTRIAVPCRVQREEVVVETCRFCANPKWNLELNAIRGLFHCWACDAGGRLDGLLEAWLGGKFHIPVQDGRDAKKKPAWEKAIGFEGMPAYDMLSAATYLQRRGVERATAQDYGLVVCTQQGHQLQGRLTLPLCDFWTGVVVGHVGRSYTGKHPKYLSTLRTRDVVVGHRVRSWSTACVLVEGNFDAITIHRAGFHAVVLGGVSAPWLKTFVARLEPVTPLVVMLDGAAREEAWRLRWVLEGVRPTSAPNRTVFLAPEMDPAELRPDVVCRLVEQVLS